MSERTLRLRKAKRTRSEQPEWSEDDYDVLSGDAAVGRIYRRTGAPEDSLPWVWTILVAGSPGRRTANGLARTLEEAKVLFAKNWRG